MCITDCICGGTPLAHLVRLFKASTYLVEYADQFLNFTFFGDDNPNIKIFIKIYYVSSKLPPHPEIEANSFMKWIKSVSHFAIVPTSICQLIVVVHFCCVLCSIQRMPKHSNK